MFKNYLTIAIRNLLRYKAYSLLNIFGLAIGMTCVLLIALFIQDEFSYDTFHKNGDRIYRILRETKLEDGKRSIGTGTSGALGPALVQNFPEVVAFTRRHGNSNKMVQYGDKKFHQRLHYIDPSILDIFTLPLAKGDPKIITHEIAFALCA